MQQVVRRREYLIGWTVFAVGVIVGGVGFFASPPAKPFMFAGGALELVGMALVFLALWRSWRGGGGWPSAEQDEADAARHYALHSPREDSAAGATPDLRAQPSGEPADEARGSSTRIDKHTAGS